MIDGIKKYGLIGVAVAIIGFVAFYVGLAPFDRSPSIAKVLVEGVIYYIGVAIIEELYVRGLLLNLIEKVFVKRKNSNLIAVVLSSVIFGLGHIFGVLNQSLLVIVSKVIWTIGMGVFFGMVYDKAQIIEVLTEQVDGRYLAYLQEKGISYFFAGKTEIDVELALKIMQDHLAPEFYLLEGGSIINGHFLLANCVNELSLVQAPMTADADSKPLFSEGNAYDFELISAEQKEGIFVMNYKKK